MAMAPESGQRAVLFYGMAGVGKTACALELAYRYETGRFERLVWHKGPDEGHDIRTRCYGGHGLGRQLPGFTMAHVVDGRMSSPPACHDPRSSSSSSILIVLDNLESPRRPKAARDAAGSPGVGADDHGGCRARYHFRRRRSTSATAPHPHRAIHPSLAEAAL
jgi:hypothetical protein